MINFHPQKLEKSRGSLAEQNECCVFIRNCNELIKPVACLGHIDDALIALHEANVLEIEHVRPF